MGATAPVASRLLLHELSLVRTTHRSALGAVTCHVLESLRFVNKRQHQSVQRQSDFLHVVCTSIAMVYNLYWKQRDFPTNAPDGAMNDIDHKPTNRNLASACSLGCTAAMCSSTFINCVPMLSCMPPGTMA